MTPDNWVPVTAETGEEIAAAWVEIGELLVEVGPSIANAASAGDFDGLHDVADRIDAFVEDVELTIDDGPGVLGLLAEALRAFVPLAETEGLRTDQYLAVGVQLDNLSAAVFTFGQWYDSLALRSSVQSLRQTEDETAMYLDFILLDLGEAIRAFVTPPEFFNETKSLEPLAIGASFFVNIGDQLIHVFEHFTVGGQYPIPEVCTTGDPEACDDTKPLTGRVVSLDGEVEVSLPGDDDAIPLKRGMVLPEGAQVFTGDQSFVKIQLPRGKVIAVSPISELTLDRAAAEEAFDPEDPPPLRLRTGRVDVDIAEGIFKSDPDNIVGPNPTASPSG